MSEQSGSRPCVYYDGACPLCRLEVGAYQRAPGGDRLEWVDASSCPPSQLGQDLDRRAALARLHVRRADGTLARGAAAFVEIWAQLPGLSWLARLARLPGMLAVMNLTYAVILRVRPLWRKPGNAGHG